MNPFLPDEMLQEELELKNSLELKSVEVAVNGKKIVKPTSFTIEKGKKYALVGDSGSGKSTLLHFSCRRKTMTILGKYI